MPPDLKFLASIPYFAGLQRPELEALARIAFERPVPRGEVLFLEGDHADSLFVVVSGRIKVFKTSPDGKEQVLRLMHPGDSFNDVTVFDGGPCPASAAAVEDTILCGFRADDLQALARDVPRVAWNIIRVLSQRLRQMVSLVEDLSFRRVTSRVAKFLLTVSPEENEHRLTQQEMAAMVGTAREMVGRSLKELEAEGAIRMERGRIAILDRGLLQQLGESIG